MTHQQILEKAIQKAIDGGWNLIGAEYPIRYELRGITSNMQAFHGFLHVDGHKTSHSQPLIVSDLIFNHDFAKALWGEKPVTFMQTHMQELWSANEDLTFDGTRWQYHLQQMVVADDPIKYLGENI